MPHIGGTVALSRGSGLGKALDRAVFGRRYLATGLSLETLLSRLTNIVQMDVQSHGYRSLLKAEISTSGAASECPHLSPRRQVNT